VEVEGLHQKPHWSPTTRRILTFQLSARLVISWKVKIL